MLPNQHGGPQLLADLGDGLILRRASIADAGALFTFNAEVFRDPWLAGPNERVGTWARDLVQGRCPGMAAHNFTVVEDTRRGLLVSSACLIPQTWTYAGIPFAVGHPELVGTHPEYRNRGLVRAQFEVLHAWSAAQGHLVQGITGIPNYYRQFGYEMAVDLEGGISGPRALMPKLPEGEPEPFRLRPAVEDDLPLILRLAGQADARSLLAAVRDTDHWRYEVRGRSPDNVNGKVIRILDTATGTAVGLVVHDLYPMVWRDMLSATLAEVLPGVSWLAAAPSLLRYLAAYAGVRAGQGDPACDWVGLSLIEGHPLYRVVGDWMPRRGWHYAWYLRVPDLVAFLRLITPVLEQRLAASAAAGHTGALNLSFYRQGVRLVFEQGRLSAVEPWQPEPEPGDTGHAGFPGQTFLQLLFGYRDPDQLHQSYPDCWVGVAAGRVLLEALFPRQPSAIWPLD